MVDLVDEKLPPPLPKKDKLKYGRIEKVHIHPSSSCPKGNIKFCRQMDDITSNGSQINESGSDETNILINVSGNKNEGNTAQGNISLPYITQARHDNGEIMHKAIKNTKYDIEASDMGMEYLPGNEEEENIQEELCSTGLEIPRNKILQKSYLPKRKN